MTKQRLLPGNIKMAGGIFWSSYQAVIPHGHSLQDIQAPEYWSNVAAHYQLRQHDELKCRAEDGQWGADLIVIEAGSRFARVMLDRAYQFDAVSETLPESIGLTVSYKGPIKKHVVIRDSDKMMLQEGFSKKTDAENWARDYAKVTA